MSDWIEQIDIAGDRYDLKDLQTEALAQQNEQGIEDIKTGNDYSLSEINTGKKWIDNKPIFRKVIQVNNPTDGSSIASGVETLVSSMVLGERSDGHFVNFTVTTQGTIQSSLFVFRIQDEIHIFNRGSMLATKATVILEYTKS